MIRFEKTAYGDLVDRQLLQVGRLGSEPALGRLHVEMPSRPVRPLCSVDNAAGELQAAVTPV